MTRWPGGESEIDALLSENRLQRVPASREQADRLVDQARTHVMAAAAICDLDPAGAYQLTYDAARKALVAILENQGLRPTSAGGHVVVGEAVGAQLSRVAAKVIRPFNRMRRTRNATEYLSGDQPAVTADDVRADMVKAQDMIDMADQVLGQMDPY